MERKIKSWIFFSLFFCFSVYSSVRVYIFSSPDCPACEFLNKENLINIGKKIGCQIELKYFNIEDITNYQKLIYLENKYKDTDNQLPVVFIGRYVLGGKQEIEKNLERIIKEYAKKGTKWPDEISEVYFEENSEEEYPVYIGFFYDLRCKECERIFYILKYLKNKYQNIIIKEFNLKERENKIIFEAISEKLKIPENKRLIPATLFIGKDYLQGKDIKLKEIQDLIEKYKKAPSICIWEINKEDLRKAEERIKKRFSLFNILTVISAGIIDGINPCAFATIIFFISYLSAIKKNKKEILFIGLSFTFGIFLVYFFIGIGFFSFFYSLSIHKILSKALNILIGLFAIIVGYISFLDYLKAKQKKINKIKLQLPKNIKEKIHKTIVKNIGFSAFLFSSFITALIISFLEFFCTGQVYLPTIVFVLNQKTLKKIGYFYLFVYNFFFIFPLLIILSLSYLSKANFKISQFFIKYLPQTKLILSLFFFFIGFYILLNGL